MNRRILTGLLAFLMLLSGCAVHKPAATTQETASETTGQTLPEPTMEFPVETTGETVPETTAPTVPETVPETQPAVPEIIYAPEGDVSLSAQQAFVYDCGNGALWVYGDWNTPIAPASLTKLFTVYIALQSLSEDTVITVGEEATWIQSGSSVAAIYPENRLSVAMLVEGCLVQSGNDAAYALAVAAGRQLLPNANATPEEALARFMEEMNAQAGALGLTGTCFVNPDGFDAEGQYTTAKDMLTITLLILNDPRISKYSTLATDNVTYESGQNYIWKTTNLLLLPDSDYYCEAAFGLKTGTTNQAGAHLIAAFHAPDRDLIIGVFGCTSKTARFTDALLLYQLGQ